MGLGITTCGVLDLGLPLGATLRRGDIDCALRAIMTVGLLGLDLDLDLGALRRGDLDRGRLSTTTTGGLLDLDLDNGLGIKITGVLGRGMDTIVGSRREVVDLRPVFRWEISGTIITPGGAEGANPGITVMGAGAACRRVDAKGAAVSFLRGIVFARASPTSTTLDGPGIMGIDGWGMSAPANSGI